MNYILQLCKYISSYSAIDIIIPDGSYDQSNFLPCYMPFKPLQQIEFEHDLYQIRKSHTLLDCGSNRLDLSIGTLQCYINPKKKKY